MAETIPIGGSRSWFAAVAAVAATYVYFLIFAEFALLERIRAVAPEQLRAIMAVLGLGGVVGGLVMAWRYRPDRARRQLAWAFRGCAAGAGLSVVAGNAAALGLVAGGVGLALGALTVALSASLWRATGGRRLGLCVGLGTGLAYAVCNLPGLFQASPVAQALAAGAIALAASWVAGRLHTAGTPGGGGREFAPRVAAGWVVALLALVWMDSAAFFVIQHTPLRNATWGETTLLLGNAFAHAVGAVAAGVAIDAGRRVTVIAGGTLLLGVASAMLAGLLPVVVAPGWCYAAGVSLYSTVLVEYPAQSQRPWLAAATFAIAGWFGSAMGIGMATDLARIPPAFVLAATAAVVGALAWRWRWLRHGLVTGVVLAVAARAQPDAAALQALGREVYMSEGCIHCHSQFIRPRAALEVERWGPGNTLQRGLAGAPPLFGTRRQGPDLSQVGNRRSPEWNRLHLMAPRAVSPGSRMPSYAHLFAPGEKRGEALVEYLASLGAETHEQRQAMIAQWQPAAGRVLAAPEAERRFQQLCVSCHGPAGHGDGVLAPRLSLRPPDWSREPWRRVRPGEDVETALSRIIKFGIPGAPMAGHEYLPDEDVVGLARYVRRLHNVPSDGRAVAARP